MRSEHPALRLCYDADATRLILPRSNRSEYFHPPISTITQDPHLSTLGEYAYIQQYMLRVELQVEHVTKIEVQGICREAMPSVCTLPSSS